MTVRNLSIAAKFWLSISFLVAGYLVSIVVAFLLGLQTEGQLRQVSQRVFPATQHSQIALAAFHNQVHDYEDAVLTGEEAALAEAAQEAITTQRALGNLASVVGRDTPHAGEIRGLQSRLGNLQSDAAAAYRDMIRAGDALPDDLVTRVADLAVRTDEFAGDLHALRQGFVDTLQAQVLTIARRSVQQRITNVIVFLFVMTVSLILVSLTINRFTLKPLAQLIASIKGDRNVSEEIYPQDEIGHLAREFGSLIARQRQMNGSLRAENSVRRETEAKLAAYQNQLEDLVKERTAELEETHRQLVQTARLAGMAEIATEVLHNVGNVLNSINIAASSAMERTRMLKVDSLAKVSGLLTEHDADLPRFITTDERGRKLPGYLRDLGKHMAGEQRHIIGVLEELAKHIAHIGEIIRVQQSVSGAVAMAEVVHLAETVEDALQIACRFPERDRIEIRREYDDLPPVLCDRHRLLQILINLLTNARQALGEHTGSPHLLQVALRRIDAEHVRLSVSDNGAGIAPDVLPQIFVHGFTTKADGHGFGLHSAALAAKELGGTLTVDGAAPGQGARFVLEIPFKEAVNG